ncbi:MAG: chemotaxis-specific protein-glutamate methyltransferase CheB [Candidatus Heimdallarchaeota archaeon]
MKNPEGKLSTVVKIMLIFWLAFLNLEGILLKKIDVLVVDDSAFMRVLLRNLLREDSRIGKIRFGHDGLDAVQKTMSFSPDVVILDIIMPRMDGITALKEIMEKNPTPVLLLSALAREEVDKALKGGLDGGAVDFLQKTSATGKLRESIQPYLLRKVVAAARANVKQLQSLIRVADVQKLPPREDIVPTTLPRKVIVFAASTGGPKTLDLIFSQFPRKTPPILVVQHMDEKFTTSFAERLDLKSSIKVHEARNGQSLRPSTGLVAPGSHFHMDLRSGSIPSVTLVSGPKVNYVRPAADITMSGAASIFGAGTLGIVLTGMGHDGLEGAKAIKDSGGMVIAEAPESCVVDSMPLGVIEAELADVIAPKERIAGSIRRLGWF